MNRKYWAGLLLSASGMLLNAGYAHAETMRAVGKAQVTKDVDSVRALAEADARRNVVRDLLASLIGRERLPEVSEDVIANLADQIPSSNILSREGEVVKLPGEKIATYKLAIDVDIDGGWLTQRIKDQNIRLPSQQAGGAGAQLMLVLDSFVGVATDSEKPQHEVTEFSSQKGASFSDTSSSAYSEKERSAASQSDKSAASGRASSAAGYSGRYGSSAGSSRVSGSSASSSRSASAYSHTINAAEKNNVQAEVHDDVYYRREVTYQGGIGKSGPANAAANAFGGALRAYGISTNPPTTALNQFKVERFKQLQDGPWQEFLSFSKNRGNNYILGGELILTNNGKDQNSGQFLCSGNISVAGFSSASSSNEGIANGYKQASSSGQSEQDCQNRLSEMLAGLLAAEIGPQIQDNWRDRARALQDTVSLQNRLATEGGEYNLTIRSSAIDFQTKRMIVDALNSLDSIRKPYVQISQNQTELAYRVNYKSFDGQDLGMTLLGALVDRNAAFGTSPMPMLSGQSVTVCLLTCN